MVAENKANAHVCDRLGLPHRFVTWFIVFLTIDLVACGLLGRELFVLIVTGQSRPSRGKCRQLHAFFVSRKMHGSARKNGSECLLSIALVLLLKTRHFHGYKNKTITRYRP